LGPEGEGDGEGEEAAVTTTITIGAERLLAEAVTVVPSALKVGDGTQKGR